MIRIGNYEFIYVEDYKTETEEGTYLDDWVIV